MSRDAWRVGAAAGMAAALAVAAACQPTVRVVPPSEPIEINLNINMDIRVRMEREIDELIAQNPELF